MWDQFDKDGISWEGLHVEQGKNEDEGAAEKKHCGLITSPSPCTTHVEEVEG